MKIRKHIPPKQEEIICPTDIIGDPFAGQEHRESYIRTETGTLYDPNLACTATARGTIKFHNHQLLPLHSAKMRYPGSYKKRRYA